MFVPNAISAVFRVYIGGYKPYVCSQYDFFCISDVNQLLQTLCSCPTWFLPYFYVNQWLQTLCSLPIDFSSISHINRWLQTLCSFSIRFLHYFAFWRLRYNLCDNAEILHTEAPFCRQEASFEHRGDVSSTGLAFERLCGVSSTGVAFWALCTVSLTVVAFECLRRVSSTGVAFWIRCSVSSTRVAFWANWFFACFCVCYTAFWIFHIHNAYETVVLHVNSRGICNLMIKE